MPKKPRHHFDRRTIKKTHCVRNHEFTAENTRVNMGTGGKPFRTCRACERLRWINKR